MNPIDKINKILEIRFGSHLYGTSTPTSDTDFKGIYLPTAREIVLGRAKENYSTKRKKDAFEKNTKDDVDREILSLQRYVELLLEGQTMALDMLFAGPDYWVYHTPAGCYAMFQLMANRHLFLNKNVNAFVGYARQQAAKYGIKGFRVAAMRDILEYLQEHHGKLKIGAVIAANPLPKNDFTAIVQCKGKNGPEDHLEVCNRKVPFHATVQYAQQVYSRIFDQYGKRALKAEKNEGVDWKALSHAVRVNCEAQELLLTGKITFPRPEKELLLKIKTEHMPYNDVAVIIEKGLEELLAAKENSTLIEKPDYDWADDFVYDIYCKIVKGETVNGQSIR